MKINRLITCDKCGNQIFADHSENAEKLTDWIVKEAYWAGWVAQANLNRDLSKLPEEASLDQMKKLADAAAAKGLLDIISKLERFFLERAKGEDHVNN